MNTNGRIPLVDLVTPHQEQEEELVSIFRGALRTAGFVGGPLVEGFERETIREELARANFSMTEAARALGVSAPRIMLRHVIPNSLAPVIVQATLWLGQAIITAAGLGFLGIGVEQPTPEWGGMLGASRDYIFSDSALITFPGLCIFGAVLAFNLVGDGLRDVLDPRLADR